MLASVIEGTEEVAYLVIVGVICFILGRWSRG